MISNEYLYKKYFKLFLTENLDIPLNKIINLMGISNGTFYNHFSCYSNFTEKTFDYFYNFLLIKRKEIKTNNFLEIIEKTNNIILDKLIKIKKIINFKNFLLNLYLFDDIIKEKYKLLVLNNITLSYVNYNNKKIDISIILEEAYYSLLIHIKNKKLNFSEFYIVSK